MAIFSLAAGIETKPCCAPSPPRCRDVDRVTAGDTRGCCCRCTGTSTEGGCAGEDSGGATVACGAGGRNAGNDSGGAAVTGVGSCCCGTDDAAGRGVDEDSGVTPVDGVDGWYHTPKPRGMQYCAVPGSNGCVDAPRWPKPPSNRVWITLAVWRVLCNHAACPYEVGGESTIYNTRSRSIADSRTNTRTEEARYLSSKALHITTQA